MLPSNLNDLLRVVDCKDLYDFLNLDRSAAAAELTAAAQKEFDRIQNKGLRDERSTFRKKLTGVCKSIFEDPRTKAEYDRALQEAAARREVDGEAGPAREFDEATALLASGWGLVTQGRTDEALAVAKRLTGDHSEYSKFRSTLAELLIAGQKYLDAADFLFWCEDEEPGNAQYKAMLGRAFAKGGTETWTRHGETTCATTAQHVADAKACLNRAREYAGALGRQDDGLSREIASLEDHIRVATQRRWNGSVLAAIGGVIFPQILFALPDGSEDGLAPVPFDSWGYLMLASTLVYVVSSMDPQWKLNARALQGPQAEGCLWYLVKTYLTVMLLPVVAAWKFCTNLLPAFTDRRTDASEQHGKTEAAPWGGAGAAVVVIGLAVVVWVVVSSLLSVPSEPTGGADVTSTIGGGSGTGGSGIGGEGGVSPEPPSGPGNGVTAPEAEPSFGPSALRRIQGGLKASGFYAGAIDGLFGPGTRRAIRNWQTEREVEATGYLDEAQAGELMALAEPADPAPPPGDDSATDVGDGRLIVRAEPGSRIDLDGIESGSTDEGGMLVLAGIRPGRHVVAAHKQGFASATGAVEIVSGDTHEVALRAEDYAPVEVGSVDVTPEREVSLAAARSRFDAGDYQAAAEVAQALSQVQADDAPVHLLLGRALYALGRYEDSIEPLRRAIALGERVELDARHRHGVGQFRQGFCHGVLTFARGEVTFRSDEDGSHDFVAAAGRITDVEVVESIDGQPFWLTSRVQDRGSQRRPVDFVHRNAVQQFRSGNSRISAILVCSGCDGSLGVQAALMRAGG